MLKIYSTTLLTMIAIVFSSAYAQLTNETVTIGAVNRTYKQYLPTGLDPQNEQVSLVIILHGLGGTSADMVGAGFNYIADTARVIALYPQGKTNAYGQNSWNNGTGLSSTADDISFMNSLIDSMIVNYNVNPARVYVTGFSMGSIMSYHLACALNMRVAAIGCMSGTMSTSDIQNYTPTYATPVIHLHGTADGTVPYNSGALPTLSLVPETMAFWQNVHGCDATADSTRITDVAADNITIDRFRYDNCSPNGSLELWRLNGADHVYLYQPINDITEMMEVWLFLRRWTHPTPAPLTVSTLSTNQLSVAPNPSTGLFQLKSSVSALFEVQNVAGKTVLSGVLNNGETTIDLNASPSGVYFLKTATSVSKLVKL